MEWGEGFPATVPSGRQAFWGVLGTSVIAAGLGCYAQIHAPGADGGYPRCPGAWLWEAGLSADDPRRARNPSK
jgi:hypothetical protein